MPRGVDDPIAEPRCQPAAAAATSAAAAAMSPCGGECRVGRTLRRGGPSAPARGADPRRRQQRPIATNKPSPPTNHRRRPPARRPPAAAPSAAQAAGAGRAPGSSISQAIAVHGLALRKASDAISPLNAVVEPGCCRTPPPRSRRQRRAPRACAREDSARAGARAPIQAVVSGVSANPPRT